MVCFSSFKRKERAVKRPPSVSHAPQASSLIYKNKPTALPKPLEVDKQLHYDDAVSSNLSFNDRSYTSPAGSSTPHTPNFISRARSTSPSFFFLPTTVKPASFNSAPKRKYQDNRCIGICTQRILPVTKPIKRSTSVSSHSGSNVNSCDRVPAFGQSGYLFPSSNGASFQSCKDAFGSCPLPLPPPQSPGHSRPLPMPDFSPGFPKAWHPASASSVDLSPNSISTLPLRNFHCNKSSPSSREVMQPAQPRPFALEEIENFSLELYMGETLFGTMYRTWIDEYSCHMNGKRKIEAVMLHLHGHLPIVRDEELKADVTSLAEIRSPNVSPLIGYFMERNVSPVSDELGRTKWLFAYEHLPKGSLDRHLYRRQEGPPLEWFTRMKIALDAAWGLMQLHDKFPNKPMYWDFQPLNIQLDRDFTAKLTGYNLLTKAVTKSADINKQLIISAYIAPEVAEEGKLSVKSVVWSFGTVLFELLTGRAASDELFLGEEEGLESCSTSCLKDASKLFGVVDPELKGRYPAKDAKIVGNLALQCLQRDSGLRPEIGSVIEVLRSVQKLKVNPVHNSDDRAAATSLDFPNGKGRSLKELLHDPDLADDDSLILTSFWSNAARLIKLPKHSGKM